MNVDAVGSWLCSLSEPYRVRNYHLFLLKCDFATHMPMWSFATRLYHEVYILANFDGRSSVVKIKVYRNILLYHRRCRKQNSKTAVGTVGERTLGLLPSSWAKLANTEGFPST